MRNLNVEIIEFLLRNDSHAETHNKKVSH